MLTSALEKQGLNVGHDMVQQWVSFLELLMRWNRVFNLTSIDQPKECVYLHIIDSLLAAPYLYGNRMLDMGSGAGLPGIPLAILFPNQQWTLLDKNSKKARFLTQVAAQLSLTNVTVVHDHCEYFQPEVGFDSILSRAFGTLHKMINGTQHLLCQQGSWIALKGHYPTAELQELPDDVIWQVNQLSMKGMDVQRHVVCMSRSDCGKSNSYY
jgi:16S rRNA (guanine527-N7)-methyltransferase